MVKDYQIDADFHLKKIRHAYQKIYECAIPYLQTRQNEIHTYIVYQYALLLLEDEPGIPDIVVPAAILHDVGWSCVPEEEQHTAFGPVARNKTLRRRHEVEGVAIAVKILHSVGHDPKFTQKIAAIIDGHDTTNAARSTEDAITKDADKLWRFSGIGFHVDHQRFNEEKMRYLKFLLEKIDEWFLTNTGREIARHEATLREGEVSQKRL